MFVNIKSQISMKHEYALMVFQETAFWVSLLQRIAFIDNLKMIGFLLKLEDFTNDPTEFIERLEYLNQTINCTRADIDSVFDVMFVSLIFLDIRSFL